MGKALVVAYSGAGYPVPDNSAPIIGMYPYFGSSSQSFRWRAIGGGTIRNLAVYVSANSTALVTSTFAVRKNGTNQTLQVTYSSGATGLRTDTSNSFTVSDGDDVDIELSVPNDTSGSRTVTVRAISFEFESDSDTVSRIGASAASSVSTTAASSSYYLTPGGVGSLTTAERAARILTDYTASDLYAYVVSNVRTTTTTIRSRKNGANGGQSVSYGSGETGVKTDTSGTDSLTSGDDFCWSLTTGTGTGTFALGAVGSALTSTNNEWDAFHGRNAGLNMTAGLTYYLAPSGGLISPTSTEAQGRAYQYFDSHYADLRANVYANAATATSYVYFRVSGADTSLSLSYSAGETGVKTDTSNVVDVTSGEPVGYRVVNGTGGAITLSYVGVTGYTDAAAADRSAIVGSTQGEGSAAATQRVGMYGVGGITAASGVVVALLQAASGAGAVALAAPAVSPLRNGGSVAGVLGPGASIAGSVRDAISGAGVVSDFGANAVATVRTGVSGVGALAVPGSSLSSSATSSEGSGSLGPGGSGGLEVNIQSAGDGSVSGSGAGRSVVADRPEGAGAASVAADGRTNAADTVVTDGSAVVGGLSAAGAANAASASAEVGASAGGRATQYLSGALSSDVDTSGGDQVSLRTAAVSAGDVVPTAAGSVTPASRARGAVDLSVTGGGSVGVADRPAVAGAVATAATAPVLGVAKGVGAAAVGPAADGSVGARAGASVHAGVAPTSGIEALVRQALAVAGITEAGGAGVLKVAVYLSVDGGVTLLASGTVQLRQESLQEQLLELIGHIVDVYATGEIEEVSIVGSIQDMEITLKGRIR